MNPLVKRAKFLIQYVAYELFYYLLGAVAIFEDILMSSRNKCENECRPGEVAVITGGARGIGAAVVKRFLECRMTVVIGCRNVDAGNRTIQNIRNAGVVTGETYVYELDLSSMQSIKEFAKHVSDNFSSISVLLNNAGIMFPPYKETVDGYESQWAVNYLGPFLLTHLLFPLLNNKQENSTRMSRIVNVTSCAHLAAKTINFDNINFKDSYIASAAYAQSKLSQILFTISLDHLLRERDSKVSVFAVHPGIVDTDLFQGTLLKRTFPWILKYICKDVESGATSVLFPCISPSLENIGGVYISNCQVTKPSKMAGDRELQHELFKHSLLALGISEFGKV